MAQTFPIIAGVGRPSVQKFNSFYLPASLKTGLVAYWSFDSTDFTDSTGNGYSLVNTGDVTVGTGLLNNASKWSGLGESQNLTSGSELPAFGTGGFALSCWQRLDEYNNAFSIIATYGGGPRWLPFISSQGQPYLIVNGTASPFNATVFIGEWTHLVFNRKPDGITEFYINGNYQSFTSISSGIDFSNGQFIIGAANDNSTSFNPIGLIDEMGVWGRSLMASEIALLYNGGTPLPYSSF